MYSRKNILYSVHLLCLPEFILYTLVRLFINWTYLVNNLRLEVFSYIFWVSMWVQHLWKTTLSEWSVSWKSIPLFAWQWKIPFQHVLSPFYQISDTLFHTSVNLDTLSELSNSIHSEKSTLSLRFPDTHAYPLKYRVGPLPWAILTISSILICCRHDLA